MRLLLPLKELPHSRDRRPRLSAFSPPFDTPLGTSPPSEGLGEAFISYVLLSKTFFFSVRKNLLLSAFLRIFVN